MKKLLISLLLSVLMIGCKKTETPQPAQIDYTIELANCPGGLNLKINDAIIYGYQLGTNVYHLKTGDNLQFNFNDNFTTTSVKVIVNGVIDYFVNNSHTAIYNRTY